MVSYKLTYFDGRGRGEVIRQIFKLAGVSFEDHRIQRSEWPALKSKTPFGHIPVLEVDGKQIPETHAIARYLARQFGLAGKTPFEQAWVDALADETKDYQAENAPFWGVVIGYKQGDKAAVEKEVGIPARDKFFTIIEKRLAANKSGFLVGDSVTWVDLMVADQSWKMTDKLPGFLDNYSKVLEHTARVHSIPNIKEWIAKRPKSDL